jgi:hypothetical protein
VYPRLKTISLDAVAVIEKPTKIDLFIFNSANFFEFERKERI